MNRTVNNVFRIAVALVLFVPCLPLFAQTQGDYKIHVDREAALPGLLLEPGDYIIHRASVSDLHILEVLKGDGVGVVGFVEGIPVQTANDKYTEIYLSAPDAAGVRMIQAWYPAGNANGYQFTYSGKDSHKLDQLARARGEVSGSAAGQP
jgi:hypothetical protein